MESDKELRLNGVGDEKSGYDQGEWRQFIKRDDEESEKQQELELMKIHKDETEPYEYVKDGIY